MDLDLPVLILAGVGTPSATLEVLLESSDTDLGPFATTVGEIMAAFVELGRLGGYAPPAVDPARSTLTLLQEVVRPRRLEYRLQAAGMDPRAFQVLRNMVARLLDEGIPISRITVRDASNPRTESRTMAVPAEDNEMEVYPKASEKLGFTVDVEEMEFSKARRCVVEHADVLRPDQVEEAVARVAAWFEVLEAGGFALPLGHPAEIDSLSDTTTQFDEISVEVSVLIFRASESAWEVLMNVLAAYSRTGVPVTRVIIE